MEAGNIMELTGAASTLLVFKEKKKRKLFWLVQKAQREVPGFCFGKHTRTVQFNVYIFLDYKIKSCKMIVLS